MSSARFWIRRPVRAWQRWLHRRVYPGWVRMKPGLIAEGRLRLQGLPEIEIDSGASVILADNVTLNSWNWRYHISLFGPVKLFAEGAGTRIVIGSNTRIHGSCLHAMREIRVGRNCLIAGNTQIFDTNGHSLAFANVAERINTVSTPEPVVIHDHVWIGAHCLILPGVTIGEGSVVAAGSVVVKDIPPMVVAGGNPAKVLRSAEEIRARR